MISEETIKRGTVLLVDDEAASVRMLSRMLDRAGYGNVHGTTEPARVPEVFREVRPDLIILDLHMPGMDGFEVMEQLEADIPEDVYLPILVLTADPAPEVKRRALLAGAKDFLTKPIDNFEFMLRLWNLLEARFLYLRLAQHLDS